MLTKVSSKGQIVLPSPIRRKLGIETGDPLQAKIEDGRIILTPSRKTGRKFRIKRCKSTGMPVISLGASAPKITNDLVREMLADFP
ncbi:MAG: AbrB/MazE/SpoVT family DNA-binding domain-containing protein [Chthoniobacteraceae bacterium]